MLKEESFVRCLYQLWPFAKMSYVCTRSRTVGVMVSVHFLVLTHLAAAHRLNWCTPIIKIIFLYMFVIQLRKSTFFSTKYGNLSITLFYTFIPFFYELVEWKVEFVSCEMFTVSSGDCLLFFHLTHCEIFYTF
jgi:hypothetical protein